MAVLSFDKAVKYIKEPSLSDRYDKMVKDHQRLKAHVNGDGFQALLKLVEGHENKKQTDARKQSAIPNIDIVCSVLKPTNKVFSAKGGSRYYNLPKSSEPEFRKILMNITGGMSVQAYNENVWLNKYKIDPNGVIFFEIPQDNPVPYPTYKAITSIHDYQREGQKLEYIIFQPIVQKEKKYYRIVDDERDYFIVREGDVFQEVDKIIINDTEMPGSISNAWGYVPGYIISDLIDDSFDFQKSMLKEVVPLLDRFLEDRSVRIIHKHKHGFPTLWFYAQKCRYCNGSGLYEGEECPKCDGSGYSKTRDVTDGIALQPPTEADQPQLAPDIMGYIVPEITSLEAMKQDLVDLKKDIEFPLWGSHSRESAENETATARFLDLQPVYDSLDVISNSANKSEKFMTDILGDFHYKNTYKGSSIKLGHRYMMETPDQILKELSEAKEGSIPEQIQLNKTNEYLESEFGSDRIELLKQKILLKITPYPLKTTEQVKELELPSYEYARKFYFGEWLQLLDPQKLMFDGEEKLRSDYTTWLNIKITENEQRKENQPKRIPDVP